jgi:hypothetical protein
MKRFSGFCTFLFVLALPHTSSTHAAQYLFEAVMSGPNEFPVNASPGTGYGTVLYDDVAHTLGLNATFSGLTGNTTASHIHAPTTAPFFQNAGVATTTPSFAGFPTGVTSGAYSNVLDLTQSSSWNPAYVTANGGTTASAEAAFADALFANKSYWNIHSSTFGGGEIRGFLVLVPEPTSIVIIALGLTGVGYIAHIRRRLS